MQIKLITNLTTLIVKVFSTLIQFLIVVVLGFVAAVLLALPWVMRTVSFAVWFVAIFMGFSSIQMIYAPISDVIPLYSLQFALILIAVAWMMGLMLNNIKHFWGGLLAGGLVIGGCAMGANWISVHWRYADLVFHTFPPVLFCILLFHETIHLRSMRQDGQLETLVPSALKSKGGDVSR
jgi:hypothetical protein